MENCIGCKSTVRSQCPDGYLSTDCVYYTGSALSCSGIRTNDRLTTILSKIDAKLCAEIGSNLFTDNTASISFSGLGTEDNPLLANSNISAEDGNSITINSDGLYVPSTGVNVSFTSIFNPS